MRTWLHVKDTAQAIIRIIESEVVNEIFNIGGNYEDKNINVLEKLIYFYLNDNNFEKYLDFNYTRPGQDVRYSINDDKLRNLGWQPNANFGDELKRIVEFNKEKFIW
jgi:dTDP-D-glucose 4,6-dehydratase